MQSLQVVAERGRFEPYRFGTGFPFSQGSRYRLSKIWENLFESPRKLRFLQKHMAARISATQISCAAICGEREIRTPDRLSPMLVFETSAFNHSAISPYCCTFAVFLSEYTSRYGLYDQNTPKSRLQLATRQIYCYVVIYN